MTMAEDAERTGARIEPTELAELTTSIVAAYVSRNAMPPSDLPQLIDAVSRGLQGIGPSPEEAPPVKAEPAVSVRRSISADQLTCHGRAELRPAAFRAGAASCLGAPEETAASGLREEAEGI
jgi:hypothetical protein